VGNNLVAWMSKKQASISLSTAEAIYCCGQLLHAIIVDEDTTRRLRILSRYYDYQL
jgi:hypothetical protein